VSRSEQGAPRQPPLALSAERLDVTLLLPIGTGECEAEQQNKHHSLKQQHRLRGEIGERAANGDEIDDCEHRHL
jgi:hypothetical protein